MSIEPSSPEFLTAVIGDLRVHLGLCETALAIATAENRALCGAGEYEPFEFFQKRKHLVTDLESSLAKLRTWRKVWQQFSSAERDQFPEVKAMFQTIGNLTMRVMQLDRENQQHLLRRGLVPPKHLSLAAGAQPSHYVASVYRRNAAGVSDE
jgi:hypothetical protein